MIIQNDWNSIGTNKSICRISYEWLILKILLRIGCIDNWFNNKLRQLGAMNWIVDNLDSDNDEIGCQLNYYLDSDYDIGFLWRNLILIKGCQIKMSFSIFFDWNQPFLIFCDKIELFLIKMLIKVDLIWIFNDSEWKFGPLYQFLIKST